MAWALLEILILSWMGNEIGLIIKNLSEEHEVLVYNKVVRIPFFSSHIEVFMGGLGMSQSQFISCHRWNETNRSIESLIIYT